MTQTPQLPEYQSQPDPAGTPLPPGATLPPAPGAPLPPWPAGDPGVPPPGVPVLPGVPTPPTPMLPGTNGLAIASLVFGLIGGVLFAVLFGVMALVQVRKRPQKGRGLAIAGLSAAGVWLLVIAGAIALGVASGADRNGSGEIVGSGRVTVDSLRPGDCISGVKEGMVRSMTAVPCAEPHDGEVFALFDLAAGTFPGEVEVARLAEEGCTDRFDAYAADGGDYEELGLYYLTPTRTDWLTDRSVLCIASYSAPITGSIRG
ncbi:MAG TPA: DUF4190 domain-containing protein [Micromonosporaceae bacterium]